MNFSRCPYEPGAEPSCSISALSARARQCGIRLQRMNLIWAARSARSELRADCTTTDVIVNGKPRIRFEKLTRYMHPPARDTSVSNMQPEVLVPVQRGVWQRASPAN